MSHSDLFSFGSFLYFVFLGIIPFTLHPHQSLKSKGKYSKIVDLNFLDVLNAIDKVERPSFPSDVLQEVREVIELSLETLSFQKVCRIENEESLV